MLLLWGAHGHTVRLNVLPSTITKHGGSARGYISTEVLLSCCCTSQFPQEHVYPPGSRTSQVENFTMAVAQHPSPAVPAVGGDCGPPDSRCAGSLKARPCSNIIAREAASEPTFSGVFGRPRQSAQTAVQSIK